VHAVRVPAPEESELAFTREEFAERFARLRTAMEREGLDALVCVAPESLYYLTGYDANTAWSEQALVVAAGDAEPTLIIRDIDVPIADRQIWLEAIADYRFEVDDPAAIAADAVRRAVPGGGTVALERHTWALGVAYERRLDRALGGAEDGSHLVAGLRVRKSESEMVYVREAAAIADEALAEAKRLARPGLTEIELAGEIEYALRKRGSEYPGMPTWLASGPKTASSHASPSAGRTIGHGEPLKCSFAAVRRRYHVTTYQAFHMGPPPELYRRRWGQCGEALEAALERIGPGEPLSEACLAGNAVMERYGIAETNMGRWGYGVGIAYPPTWLEPLDITAASTGCFDVGMVFCLHVSMSEADPVFGFTLGANYTVTRDGVERVNAAPPTVHVVED
jgi:Xaa-Pro dipeptidase